MLNFSRLLYLKWEVTPEGSQRENAKLLKAKTIQQHALFPVLTRP